MVKIYEVGGSVRDVLLGIPAHNINDIDFAVEASSYDEMKESLLRTGVEIFLERPEFLTIRGRIGRRAADWVLCRKDGFYSDGRRPDEVVIGTIYDDLARRDFTINAIAVDSDGNVYDPYNGVQDVYGRIIRCVGSTEDRMKEDALRMIRAIRFTITKDMQMTPELYMFLSDINNVRLLKNVSVDRIREELNKCFRYDTPKTLDQLCNFYLIRDFIFQTEIWLLPTTKES